MNRRAKGYCFAVILTACVVLPFQNWHALIDLPLTHLYGVAALIGVAVLSEILSVNATVGTHKAPSSIAFIPFFACAILFPAPTAVCVTALTFSFAQFFVHRRPPFRALFNVAQATISMAVANAVFESWGGTASATLQTGLMVRGAPALLGMALTFFFLNQLSVSVAIALINTERVATMFTRMVSATGSNLVYDLLASPIAVVVALLYSNYLAGGILVGILPLLIIRHSYASNVKLQQANKDLLAVLIKTIETRDPYTSGHSIRVSILARAIAEDMNLSVSVIDRIEMAALVHDIGKVDAVYASIIRKEGSLTDSEKKVIVTHAAKGAEFLKTLTSVRDDVISGVKHHHERYDGSGYPDGLLCEKIPLASRIIMLCDSIDAMLSDRPYRKALSVEFVRAEILRCAGSQFDPRIVEIILRKNTLERAASLVRPEKGPEKEPEKTERWLAVASA
jgi:putative nucleotidyltransferase with HDIG domain